MNEEQYMEICRRIHSRIYRHTHTRGSIGTHEKNKVRADECIQILKIIENILAEDLSEVEL